MKSIGLSGFGRVAALACLVTLSGVACAQSPAATPPAQSSVPASSDQEEFDLVLTARTPGDIVAMTHTGQLSPSIPFIPSGMKELVEPALDGGIILTVQLRDQSGKVIGFGAQASAMPIGPDGQIAKMEWPSEWMVTIPSRGTLFLSEIERTGNIFGPFQKAGREKGVWRGEMEVRTTVGPTARGNGVVTGGTGEFLGKTGVFVEMNRFSEYDFSGKGSGPVGEIELNVRFN